MGLKNALCNPDVARSGFEGNEERSIPIQRAKSNTAFLARVSIITGING